MEAGDVITYDHLYVMVGHGACRLVQMEGNEPVAGEGTGTHCLLQVTGRLHDNPGSSESTRPGKRVKQLWRAGLPLEEFSN